MAYDFNAVKQQYLNSRQQPKQPEITSDIVKVGKSIISPFTTAFDFAEDVVSGAAKSVEGIVDYGMGLLGSAASFFGSDNLENALTQAAKFDFTGNTISKLDDWAEDSSWLSNDSWLSNTVHQVAEGVGGMLPAIAVGAVTGGAGLASAAVFGAGAAGQSTEQALKEGASIGQATAYGTLSGGTEMLLESISPTKLFVPGGASKVLSGGLKGLAGTFIEEGVEEVASDLINPLLKRATYTDTIEMPSFDELAQTFAVGGLTALTMGGAAKATNVAKYGVKGEQAVSKYNQAAEVNAELYDLEKKGKLTQEKKTELLDTRNKLLTESGNLLAEISNETKKARTQQDMADFDKIATFNEKKQAVYETVDLMNKKYKTDIKVQFVSKDALNKFANEKSTVDGYIDDKTNTIYINESAADPYSVVIAHEITHTTENNQLYNDLSKDILSTMSEQELSGKRSELSQLYEGATTEMIDKEIVADYVSKMLGSDSKTLLNTFTRKPNIVTKVFEWIESKLSKMSENNAEYKQYIELRNKFRKVLSQNNVETTSKDNVKYKLSRSYMANADTAKEVFGEDAYYDITKELNRVYNGKYGIKGDTLIYSDNSLYIVDSSFDKNGLKFAVYDVIDVNGTTIYKEAFKEVLEDAIAKQGLYSEEIRSSIHENDVNWDAVEDIRTHFVETSESGNSGQNISGESRDNQEGNDGETELKFLRRAKNPPEGQTTLELDFEAKQEPTKVETITQTTQEAKEAEIDETLRNKVKTKLIEDDMSFLENLKGLTEKGKEAIKDIYTNKDALKSNLQIYLTNSFAGVENELKKKIEQEGIEKGWTKKEIKEEQQKQVEEISIAYNNAYRATSKAEYKIGYDLKKIWQPINKKGAEYTSDFELLLLHRSNIKRMDTIDRKTNVEEDYKNGLISKEDYDAKIEEINEAVQKPVFGKDVSADYSREQEKALLKKHPEFNELADKVYDYIAELMQIRKDAGIVNQEQIDRFFEWYGDRKSGKSWYVPTYRDLEHGANLSGISGNIGVTKGIFKAKGSDLDIQSIMLSMAEQTIGTYKQTSINELFTKIKEKMPEYFELVDTTKQNRNDMNGEIEVEKDKNKNTTVYFYEDGNRMEYRCPAFIGVAFNSIRNQQNDFEKIFANTTGKMVSLLKKVTTEWNPMFAVRNLFRDASDTFIYSKYSKNLLKRYIVSASEIKKGDKSAYLTLYNVNGGSNFSFFDKETGISNKKKFFLLDKISKINEATELMPRLSEFMESLKAQGYENITMENMDKIPQDVINKAMWEASEVTVNFARGGTFTKKMNKYFMPYLNASVQGWCKMYNTFVHPESVRALGLTMARVVMMALPTIVFNELMFDDDEDYKQLSDEVKGSYFLIKAGNNKFIRIPRGRVEAVVGDAMQRGIRAIKGEEDAFKGYAETTLANVSPIENMTRTILSPIQDVKNNTTWYGGQIENKSMLNKPVKERYDSDTSGIAKFLSNVYPKLSPKKWHYLLDQYSGIIGDIVLPLTSKNGDMASTLTKASGFYVNSLNNNKYTNQFYDMQEQLTQAKNSENASGIDDAKMRYFNKMNSKINELYKEKKTLSKEEAEATQLLIVQLQKQTLDNLKIFTNVLSKYENGLNTEELYDDYYREATRECFGAETALMDYDSRVYEKATIFNNCGIDWNTLYNIYFDAKDITADYDEDGKAISGSKKEKVTKYVKSLKLTATQKYMVMGLLGYKNANGEQQVKSFLRSKGYTGKELENIMKLCGY